MLSLTCSKVIIHRSSRCRAEVEEVEVCSPCRVEQALSLSMVWYLIQRQIFCSFACYRIHVHALLREACNSQELGLSDTQWSKYSRGPTCQDEGTTEPGCLVGELLKFYQGEACSRAAKFGPDGWERWLLCDSITTVVTLR